MTAGGDLGNRTVVARGETASGDGYFVEEVTEGKAKVRRLVFASNPRAVQTEVALLAPKKQGKKKAKGPPRVDHADVRSSYAAGRNSYPSLLRFAAFL